MGIGVANQVILSGDERLDLAKALVDYLEAGEETKVNETIDQLTNLRESELFNEVGKLTRELHDSLGNCFDPDTMSSIANQEIPNARERLNYVIQKTEESANRTLSAVEETAPIAEELDKEANEMASDWERFKRREMTADDFRDLTKRISSFLETVSGHSTKINSQVTEILMAQEYQDLTGQTIKQVIDIVEKVETSLVDLIRCQGLGHCPTEDNGPDLKAEGPQVNAENKSNVMSSQDDVDDLLSSLGVLSNLEECKPHGNRSE